MKHIKRKCKRILDKSIWLMQVVCSHVVEILSHKDEEIAFFDPSIDTENLGDNIISYYCRAALETHFDCDSVLAVQTHYLPDKEIRRKLLKVKRKIVFGTNLIAPYIERYSIWAFPRTLLGYRNTIAMGVGAGYYSENVSKLSAFIYRRIFAKKALHSVRDSNTENLFHKMGINNVVNTGCPTLWNLTPEHCRMIPKQKAQKVITTITDYDRNPDMDAAMLAILKEEYDKVYVWIQGTHDLEYVKTLVDDDSIEIVERSLKAYTAVLEEGGVDYVGTRLHAGIHALNHQIRSLIISIDNRAAEMGKDFAIPILARERVVYGLRNWIYGNQETKLVLPWDKISLWKSQFERRI